MKQSTRNVLAIVGVAFVVLVIISIVADHHTANQSPQLTSTQRQEANTNFIQGCTEQGSDASYCACVGDNFSKGLDMEKLNYLTTIQNDQDKLIQYVTPYTVGC